MRIYITVGKEQDFEKQVKRASRHLGYVPEILWLPIERKEARQFYLAKYGVDEVRYFVNVHPCEIEEITSGDWLFVANVHYEEGLLAVCNREYYSQIPSQFGIEYQNCDFCGKKHSHRKLSHIIYNKVTCEWKQIGISCASVMLKNGDISKFITRLVTVIECYGCEEGDFDHWVRNVPEHSLQAAISAEKMISIIKDYRENAENGMEWVKTVRVKGIIVEPGTAQFILDWMREHKCGVDAEYSKEVLDYVNSLPSDAEYWGGGQWEEGFNDKIKAAFEGGIVILADIWAAYWAVKKYEDDKTNIDWMKHAEKYTDGGVVKLKNAKLVSCDRIEGYYGFVLRCVFSFDGYKFCKDFSNRGAVEKFRNEDGTYSFSAHVKKISPRGRSIILGGRASKC